MIIEKFKELREKFYDKGEAEAFHWFVIPPPPFEFGKAIGSYEEQIEIYFKILEKVYGEEWDYWNTWIDHQNYR